MQPRVRAGRVEARQRRPGQSRAVPRTAEQGRPGRGRGGHQDEVRDTAVQDEPGRAGPGASHQPRTTAPPPLRSCRPAFPGWPRWRSAHRLVAGSGAAALPAASSPDSSRAATASTAVLRKGPQNKARPISWATMPTSVKPAPRRRTSPGSPGRAAPARRPSGARCRRRSRARGHQPADFGFRRRLVQELPHRAPQFLLLRAEREVHVSARAGRERIRDTVSTGNRRAAILRPPLGAHHGHERHAPRPARRRGCG